MRKLLLLSICLIPFVCGAQQINPQWEDALKAEIEAFKNCDQVIENGVNKCHAFIGSSLKTVYNINDFNANAVGQHMVVSEIVEYVENSDQWTFLGKGHQQDILNKAQENANAKKAVVALYLNKEGIGMMALILPGNLHPSGTWNMQAPNSASFFTATPERSYAGKGLSYSFDWKALNEVKIYSRNF